MAKMHTPVDHMFRAGQISSKEWAKLHPNEHGGGKGSQKSKMAKFESKEKDEGNTKKKSVSGTTTSRAIDTHQEMGKPAHAGGKPSKGGSVGGSKKSPTTRAINENQKPLFPPQGGGKSRKTLSAQQPATTNETKGSPYGGPSSREDKPIRVW